MPGRYSTISIDEVIASTKMQLRLHNTTEHDDFFDIMINEAIRHLGALSIFVKRQCTLDFQDQKAKLPNGFHKLIGLRFINNLVQDTSDTTNAFLTSNNCFRLLYVDKDFLCDCECAVPTTGVAQFDSGFQIQNGFIHLNSDLNLDKATLAFIGLNVDDNDRLIVFEDHERALRAYGCYKFALSYSEDFKEATIERYKREWMMQKAWIKGSDAANDFQRNKREVQQLFNALLISRLQNF